MRGLLRRARLLTLTGPGGSGKTRLAIAGAGRVANERADAVFFVELAGIADPTLVAETAATAVGIRVPSQRAAAEALAEHLAAADALLVLDTCEHVIEECASLAETLLRGCPGITVLATSREPLRCPGELSWRVPGLGVPAPDTALPELLRACESVRLFTTRAAESAPGFELDAANARAVAAICFAPRRAAARAGARCRARRRSRSRADRRPPRGQPRAPRGRRGGPARRGRGRSALPSRGATTCWSPTSVSSSAVWPSSPARSASTRARTSAPDRGSSGDGCSTCSRASSTSRS